MGLNTKPTQLIPQSSGQPASLFGNLNLNTNQPKIEVQKQVYSQQQNTQSNVNPLFAGLNTAQPKNDINQSNSNKNNANVQIQKLVLQHQFPQPIHTLLKMIQVLFYKVQRSKHLLF
eukprot:403345762